MSRGLSKLTARLNQRIAVGTPEGDPVLGYGLGYNMPADFEEMQKMRAERDLLLSEKNQWLQKVNEDNLKLSEAYRDLQEAKELLMVKFNELDTAKAKFRAIYGDCDLEEFEENFLMDSELSTGNRMKLPEEKRESASDLFGALVAVWARLKANQIEILNSSAGRIKEIEKLFFLNRHDDIQKELTILFDVSATKPGNIIVADDLTKRPLYQTITSALLEKSVLGLSGSAAVGAAPTGVAESKSKKKGEESLEAQIKNLQAQNHNLKSTLAMERRKLSRLRMQIQHNGMKTVAPPESESASVRDDSSDDAIGGVIKVNRSRRVSTLSTMPDEMPEPLEKEPEAPPASVKQEPEKELQEADYNEFIRNRNQNVFTDAAFDYLPEQIRIWASESLQEVTTSMLMGHPLGSGNNPGLSVSVERAIATEIAAQVRGVVGAMLRASFNIESLTYDAPVPGYIDQAKIRTCVEKVMMSAALYMEVQSLATMALTFVYNRFGNVNEGPGAGTQMPHLRFEEFMKDSNVFDFNERPLDQPAEGAYDPAEYDLSPPIHDIPQPVIEILQPVPQFAKPMAGFGEDMSVSSESKAMQPAAATPSQPQSTPSLGPSALTSPGQSPANKSGRPSFFEENYFSKDDNRRSELLDIRMSDLPTDNHSASSAYSIPINIPDSLSSMPTDAQLEEFSYSSSYETKDALEADEGLPKARTSLSSVSGIRRESGVSRASGKSAQDPVIETVQIEVPRDTETEKTPDVAAPEVAAPEVAAPEEKPTNEDLQSIKVSMLRHNYEKKAKEQDDENVLRASQSGKASSAARLGVGMPGMAGGAGKGGLSALRRLRPPPVDVDTQPPPVIKSRQGSIDHGADRASMGGQSADDDIFNYFKEGDGTPNVPATDSGRVSSVLDFGSVYGEKDFDEFKDIPGFVQNRNPAAKRPSRLQPPPVRGNEASRPSESMRSSESTLPSETLGPSDSSSGRRKSPLMGNRLVPPVMKLTPGKSPLARAWQHSAEVTNGSESSASTNAGMSLSIPADVPSGHQDSSPRSSHKEHVPLSPSAKEKLSEATAFDLNDMD